MKRLSIAATVIVLLLSTCVTQESSLRNRAFFDDMSAAKLVSQIKVGWSLGNTLDASDLEWLGDNPTVPQLETGWGNPITTKANIDAIKNAGFNAIRIPVSWAKCADSEYNIREDWMARVKEVVDYAVANDMFIILNTHHDEGIFKFRNSQMEESQKAFKKIWEQIADNFKDYNEKLIFEGLNEPRTIGSPAEWNGGSIEERNNLNIMMQLFVDTVRASGGYNPKRVLMITGYAASADYAVLNAIKIPVDAGNKENKLVVSVHAYIPYNFALNKNNSFNTWSKDNTVDTSTINATIDRAYNLFVSKGIPAIMGEFGAMNKENIVARVEWARYYAEYARSKDIPCFWWDNGLTSGEGERFGLLNRTTNGFFYPEIVSAITGLTVSADPYTSTTIIILSPNAPWGWQRMYEIDSLPSGAKITQGTQYTFTYSFKSNIAMDNLEIVLVDNSAAVSYWNELSEYYLLHENIEADTVLSGTVTLTASKTASSATVTANKLAFGAGNGTLKSPTLTFDVFKFKKAEN
jgi:endoglucanase